jgi:hypothetical protein
MVPGSAPRKRACSSTHTPTGRKEIYGEVSDEDDTALRIRCYDLEKSLARSGEPYSLAHNKDGITLS